MLSHIFQCSDGHEFIIICDVLLGAGSSQTRASTVRRDLRNTLFDITRYFERPDELGIVELEVCPESHRRKMTITDITVGVRNG